MGVISNLFENRVLVIISIPENALNINNIKIIQNVHCHKMYTFGFYLYKIIYIPTDRQR